MKALTLTQPWATLVAVSAKRIETRSWSTSYRGPLAIHAAKGFPAWARQMCLDDPFKAELLNCGIRYVTDLPRAVVIATAELIDCLPIRQNRDPVALPRFEAHAAQYDRDFGDYAVGRWMWLLADVKKVDPPMPACGSLGLWEWRPVLEAVAP